MAQMGIETAPVLLYYNGELKNEGNVVQYKNGKTKLFQVVKMMKYDEFCVKIEEVCGFRLSDGYKVMTRMRLDDCSVVAVDCSDDVSLETAMDMHPSGCSVVVFYVVRDARNDGVRTGLSHLRTNNFEPDASSISNGRDVNGRYGIQVDRVDTQQTLQLASEQLDDRIDRMIHHDINVQPDDTYTDGVLGSYGINAPSSDPVNNDEENIESNSSHKWDFAKQFTTSKLFNGREELIDWARKLGMSLGFVVLIKKSSKVVGKGKQPHCTLQCDLSGFYRERNRKEKDSFKVRIKKRNTKSKLTGCPFELRATKKGRKGDAWQVRVIHGHHNHPPKKRLEGHPYAERLTEEENKLVTHMIKIDRRPKEILDTLKELFPGNCSKISTIYNAKRKIERMIKAQMQHALDNYDLEYNDGEEDCERTRDETSVNPGGVVDS